MLGRPARARPRHIPLPRKQHPQVAGRLRPPASRDRSRSPAGRAAPRAPPPTSPLPRAKQHPPGCEAAIPGAASALTRSRSPRWKARPRPTAASPCLRKANTPRLAAAIGGLIHLRGRPRDLAHRGNCRSVITAQVCAQSDVERVALGHDVDELRPGLVEDRRGGAVVLPIFHRDHVVEYPRILRRPAPSGDERDPEEVDRVAWPRQARRETGRLCGVQVDADTAQIQRGNSRCSSVTSIGPGQPYAAGNRPLPAPAAYPGWLLDPRPARYLSINHWPAHQRFTRCCRSSVHQGRGGVPRPAAASSQLEGPGGNL